MAKRLWSTLSQRTKDRYKKHGVTPQMYNSGKLDSEYKRVVQGKSNLAILTAKQRGLKLPDFDKLPKAERTRLANAYRDGLIAPRNPLTGARNALGLPQTERVYTPFLNSTRSPVEVTVDPVTGFETYHRTTYNNAGNPVIQKLDSYGRPMRSTDALRGEMDFIDALDDNGIEVADADLWNDERRSALEASSG